MLTRDDLVAVMPRAASAADGVTEALGAAMARFEIDRPARKAAFLAQLAHESGQLSRWAENLSYRWPRLRQIFPKYFRTDAEAQAFDRQPERIANRVYGGRLGNGPEASGDGWRYRGRGPIQLTGKSNYRTCGAALGVDLVAEPALLETPEVGCLAAAWFWADKGLNALADAGDFVTITRRINGGLIGLADRRELWERAKAVFGVAPAMREGVEAEAVRGAARRLRPARRPAARPRRRRAARAQTRMAAAKARRSARAATRRRAAARGAFAGRTRGPQGVSGRSRPAASRPAASRPAANRPPADRPAANRPATNRPIGRPLAGRFPARGPAAGNAVAGSSWAGSSRVRSGSPGSPPAGGRREGPLPGRSAPSARAGSATARHVPPGGAALGGACPECRPRSPSPAPVPGKRGGEGRAATRWIAPSIAPSRAPPRPRLSPEQSANL